MFNINHSTLNNQYLDAACSFTREDCAHYSGALSLIFNLYKIDKIGLEYLNLIN